MPGPVAGLARGVLPPLPNGSQAGALILGSASPRRRALLSQIGVVADAVLPAEIDETPRKGELPRAYARRIAGEKCAAVAAALAERARSGLRGSDEGERSEPREPFILTADTVVGVGRRILGKPDDAAQAAQFLLLLSGRRHRVTTCVCLRHAGRVVSRTVETRVSVKRLSDEELSAYLRSEEWRGKAGGYAIQGLFGAFVPEIIGSYTNVVGLPLAETAALLAGMGYRVPYEPAQG